MDRAEFEKKILPLGRKLYSFAYRYLQGVEDAEDAVQEVFIKLWRKKDSLNDYNSVEALAVTMTRNHCLDRLRKAVYEVSSDKWQVDTRTNDMDPHREAEAREDYNSVLQIIDALPSKYKNVITLRDVYGLGYDEIVDKLGINVNTLRVNLSRARKMVREKLGNINYESEGTRQTAG